MTSDLFRRGPRALAQAGATFRSITASALLATLLLGAGAAQAALVVIASSATLHADTSASAEAQATETATDGFIDKRVVSQVFLDSGDGALAQATVNSSAGPTFLFGFSESQLQMKDGVTGMASVDYQLLFTVTHKTQLTAYVSFVSTGPGDLLGSFDLFLGGPGGSSLLSANEASPDIDALLTLEPGQYSIVAHTGAVNLGDTPGRSGVGLIFNLLAADVVDPPAAVPEPQSLALVLAALLAGAAVHQRRRGSAPVAA